MTTDAISPLKLKLSVLALAFLSLFCFVICWGLYPTGFWFTIPIVLLFAVLASCKPYIGFAVLLGCVPWLSFAKWTGAMVIEEIDLALLSTVFGIALHTLVRPVATTVNYPLKLSLTIKLLLMAAWLSLAWACWHGYQQLPASGSIFFTNYEDSGGAIRTAKAAVLALLLYKACQLLTLDMTKFTDSLVFGMCLGLAVALSGTLFERWYFTGLTDLSTDYRTTAWFWEMHTGGATLDAYLALCLPFLWLALVRWQHWVAQVLLLSLSLLLAYSALTTFSRGVYLALPVVGLTMFMLLRRLRQQNHTAWNAKHIVTIVAVLAGGVAAAALAFLQGGYRAAIAVQGAMAALLLLFAVAGQCSVRSLLSGLALGMLLTPLLLISVLIGKGPYLLYALLLVVALVMFYLLHKQHQKVLVTSLAVASTLLLCHQAALICWYWDDTQGVVLPLLVAAILLLVLILSWLIQDRLSALYHDNYNLLKLWLAGAGVAIVTAMFLASSFIDARIATTDRDLAGRFSHWTSAVEAMPDQQSWPTGAGVGRFVALNRERGDPDNRVAQFALLPLKDGQQVLHIKSGTHMHGYGEMLRITQLIDVPQGEVTLSLTVRNAQPARMLFEICDKQLLYHGKCQRVPLELPSSMVEQQLTDVAYQLSFGENVFNASWRDALIDKTFSLAVSSANLEVLLQDISLRDNSGRELLQNGDFSSGFKHWFFSSDKHHMPYHLKGLLPLQFFEQGLVGVMLWSCIFIVVLFRALFSTTAQHRLHYAVASGLLGMFLVGLFDSVIDSARLAVLYFWLLLLGSTTYIVKKTG